MLDLDVAHLRRQGERARVAHDQGGVAPIPQNDGGGVRSHESVAHHARRSERQERTEQKLRGRPLRARNDAVLACDE
jgi:hypothetical protein